MTSPPEPTPHPTAGASTSKRPVWVWVISIFYAASLGFTLLSFVLLVSGVIPLTPPQRAYFAALGPFDYVMTIGLSLLTLTATVFLFLMRKAAAPLFATSFVVNVGFSLVHALTTTWTKAMGGSGLVGALFGWGILGAVAVYSGHLRRVGVLK
jgi:hypothetical protein